MHTLADMERITGAPRRSIQFWCDQGVLKPGERTLRAGKGKHRRFDRNEAIIACAIYGFARRHLSIGELFRIGTELRWFLTEPGEVEAGVRSNVELAIRGEIRLFLVYEVWGEGRQEHTVVSLIPSGDNTLDDAKDAFTMTFENLDRENGFMTAILLNTYTKGLG